MSWSLLGRGGIEEYVLEDCEEDCESRRFLGQGFGAGLKLGGGACCWGLLVGGWSKSRGGSAAAACGRCAAMRHDRAPSDCCDRTLGFLGREKFSTTGLGMLGSVGVLWRLSTGDSRFETGERRAIGSCCRGSRGNLRVSAWGGDEVDVVADSGDSGM